MYFDENEIPFFDDIETTTWDFENGDKITIEKSEDGYLFGGIVKNQIISDDDGEDFYLKDTDELLDFLKKYNLLHVLSKNKGKFI